MPGGVEGGGKKRGRPPKNPTLHAVGKTQHLSLFAGPDGLLHMSGEEVDRKLWEGAHTEGWDVVEAKANSHIQGSWRYVSLKVLSARRLRRRGRSRRSMR